MVVTGEEDSLMRSGVSDYDAVQVNAQRDAGKWSAVRLVTVPPPPPPPRPGNRDGADPGEMECLVHVQFTVTVVL